jgi:DNA-binding SARP family transcriptional activator
MNSESWLCTYLLGGFRLTFGGETIDPQRLRLHKARNLIKLLALSTGRRLHREQVLDRFWPDADPGAASNSLYRALYVARRFLASFGLDPQRCIGFEDGLLSLCPEVPVWIDVEAFEGAAAQARANRDPGLYREALEKLPASCCPRIATRSGRSRAAGSYARNGCACCSSWISSGRRDPSI